MRKDHQEVIRKNVMRGSQEDILIEEEVHLVLLHMQSLEVVKEGEEEVEMNTNHEEADMKSIIEEKTLEIKKEEQDLDLEKQNTNSYAA